MNPWTSCIFILFSLCRVFHPRTASRCLWGPCGTTWGCTRTNFSPATSCGTHTVSCCWVCLPRLCIMHNSALMSCWRCWFYFCLQSWLWVMETDDPLLTFVLLSLQVPTPWSALGCVKKANSSPWSCCRASWGASRRVTSISPWARSSSCWGPSWASRDRGERREMPGLRGKITQKHEMNVTFKVLFSFTLKGASTEICCF